MAKLPALRSKVEYFNIAKGDLVFVVEEGSIFKKVVKVGVGMSQIHYMYNFELEDVEATQRILDTYYQQRILPIVSILASSKTSISHNRMFNDILLELNGREPKTPDAFRTRPDLAPDSLIREVLKMLGGMGVEDVIIDELLDGKLYNYMRRKFVHIFYTLNYDEIRKMAMNWETYKPFIVKMREDTIALEKELLEAMQDG